MTNISFDPSGRQPPGLLARIVGSLIGAAVLVGAFMFSAVVFIAIAIAGVVLWGYFWWKTRALRRQLQAQMGAHRFGNVDEPPDSEAVIIEGESTRLDEERGRLK